MQNQGDPADGDQSGGSSGQNHKPGMHANSSDSGQFNQNNMPRLSLMSSSPLLANNYGNLTIGINTDRNVGNPMRANVDVPRPPEEPKEDYEIKLPQVNGNHRSPHVNGFPCLLDNGIPPHNEDLLRFLGFVAKSSSILRKRMSMSLGLSSRKSARKIRKTRWRNSAPVEYTESSESTKSLASSVCSVRAQPSAPLEASASSDYSSFLGPVERSSPSSSTDILTAFESLDRSFEEFENNQAEKAELQLAEQKQEAETAKTPEPIKWCGGSEPAKPPAELYKYVRLAEAKCRAQAIYVGQPSPEWLENRPDLRTGGPIAVYAIYQPEIKGLIYKILTHHSTPEDVKDTPEIEFKNIQLREDFAGLEEKVVERITKFHLNAVCGYNDRTTL